MMAFIDQEANEKAEEIDAKVGVQIFNVSRATFEESKCIYKVLMEKNSNVLISNGLQLVHKHIKQN